MTLLALGIITIDAIDLQDDAPLSTPDSGLPLSIDTLKSRFPDRFDKIGSFKGAAKIHLKPDAQPSIDPPRKCSVHIKPKLKQELDHMESLGIIRKVETPTDWCSSITTVVKKDGSIRVCLDPRRLNDALKRCSHKIPTLEELNPEFANAKVFSKLDAKSGYWAVHLEESSQEITTFRTPFGRYCFRRHPFGLAISQDIFQQHMDNILEKVPGCVGIADDIVVFGTTRTEHDQNLLKLMQVAQEEGLVFNGNKCTIGAERVSFYGAIYSSEGILPDPKKVEDIKSMPTPQDKDDLQRFLGMVNYLSSYIPNLHDKEKILRDLLKSNVPFTWQTDHQHAFESLKTAIAADCCLNYYDPSKPTTLEVDASMKGLGAVLTQEGRVVAYSSKTLTPAQSNYSNIEREMLAMVNGIARFHTYLFGTEFQVLTDHKPLEMICRKPITSAPPRLQRLLVKIQGYNCHVKYKAGKEMFLSDTLSRLPNPSRKKELRLDEVDTIDVEDSDTLNLDMDLVHFGNNKRQQLIEETARDPILHQLSQLINDGWPDTIKEVPPDLRPYWSYREELGIAGGVIFKGRQVIIPEALQADILLQLHQGHMGIERTRRLARMSVHWPNISRDIEVLVKDCMACQERQPKQRQEPLMPHDVPSAPWTKLATDIFTINKEDYLVVVDYHSKFHIVRHLRSMKSSAVTEIMSDIFGMFGIPSEVVSDNGTQYTGAPFQDMMKKYGVKHTTSSPRFPQSNGLAERTVRTVKNTIIKCKQTGQDINVALLHHRATPGANNLPSPAELLFGRPLRTTLPSCQQQGQLQQTDVFEKLLDRVNIMKKDHDNHAGPTLPPLHVGQKVMIRDTESNTWKPGAVLQVCKEPRSYMVETPNGSSYRRNRQHLRELATSSAKRRVHFEDDSHPKPDQSIPDTAPVVDEQIEEQVTETTVPSSPKPAVSRYGRVIRKPQRYRDDS